MSSSDLQVGFRSTPQFTASLGEPSKPLASINIDGIRKVRLSHGFRVCRPSGYFG